METKRRTYRETVETIARALGDGVLTYEEVLGALHAATQAHARRVGQTLAHYDESHALWDVPVQVAGVSRSLREVLGLPDDRPEARQADLTAQGWLYVETQRREIDGQSWDARILSDTRSVSRHGDAPTVEILFPPRPPQARG